MKKEDFKEFCNILAGLADIFTPEKAFSKSRAEIYFNAFQDMDIEVFRKACSIVVQSKTISTFPLPGEIRQALQPDKTEKEASALLAINKIENAIREHGRGRTVIFDDPYIHVVIDRNGGWPKVCELSDDPENWKWAKKDLCKHYQAISGMHPAHLEIPLTLPGTHEINNSSKNFILSRLTRPVAYIGTKRDCENWQKQITSHPSNLIEA